VLKRLADRAAWLVVLGPAILFGPGLLQGRVMFWGTPLLQFVPWRSFALSSLRQGFLPLWNPLVGMGAPLLANYQSALLYPPNLLLLAGNPGLVSTMLVMLHLAWAGIGMARLARRLDMDSLGQALAGLAFGLSGYLVARAGFLSINATAAWLPWMVLAGDRLAVDVPTAASFRRRAKAIIPLAVVLAFQWTAGHAQTAWYSLVFLAAWVAWRSFEGRSWRRLIGNAAGVAVAGGLAFALAAPQLLPTLEYLMQSYRAHSLEASFAMNYSFWPWRFLGLLAPGLFGSPVTGDYWGYGNFWEDAIYVGILPVLLALLSAVRGARGRGSHVRLTRFLLPVMAVAALLALGDRTPVFPWLFRTIPTFSLFQAPTRWMLLVVFGLALMGGAGVSAWSKVEGRALYWSRLGTAGAGAVAGAAWLARLILGDVEPTLIRAVSIAGVWLFLAGVLVLLRRAQAGGGWSMAVMFVVVADLVVAGAGLNPMTSGDLYQGRTALADRLGAQARVYFPPDLEQRVKFEWAFRFDTFHALGDWEQVRESGLPNTLLLEAVPAVTNFDPLEPGRTRTWIEMLVQHPAPDALLRLMDVRWVAETGLSPAAPVEYVPIDGGQRLRLLPTARLVTTPEEALAAVSQPGFDPDRVVVLEAEDGPSLPEAGGGGTAALLASSDPNRLTINVHASGPAWLLVSDTWYSEWEARLDGAGVEIWRADYLFRAVHVPKGDHQVEFIYRPRSFCTGLALAGAGLLLLAAAWILGVRQSRADALSLTPDHVSAEVN